MTKRIGRFALGPMAWGLVACSSLDIQLREYAVLPDTPGVAGPFVGVSHGALLMAGGANFPQRPPWKGGAKVWHSNVYVLTAPDAAWEHAGRLNRPVAYGVSIDTDRGVLCIGGCDEQATTTETFFLVWEDGRVQQRPFVPLPNSIACAGGVRIGSRVYVAGGQPRTNPLETPSLASFYVIDLDAERSSWSELPTWPGPERFYPVVGSDGQALYLFSGFRRVAPLGDAPANLEYLTDAYRYNPDDATWTRLADLPRPNAAAPSPAPYHDGKLLLVGNGADGSGLDLPLSDRPPIGGEILAYDIANDTWSVVGHLPFGLVTIPATRWHGMTMLVSGEWKPGLRTPRTRGVTFTTGPH